MSDLLVKLYELPPLAPVLEEMAGKAIVIRRALRPEMNVVGRWVEKHFGDSWKAECQASISQLPVTCFLATDKDRLVGFGCHEATCKGFFGPTGVIESHRRRGIGKALLLACLHDMHAYGYGYAIIGDAGPVEYYRKACGAIVIEGSKPGIYPGMLRKTNEDSAARETK